MEDDDNIFFESTQMQGRHEDTLVCEKNEAHTKGAISRLQSFKNSPVQASNNSTNTKRHPKEKTKSRVRKPAKTKHKSMNSLVRNAFSDKLEYLSGNQRKIDDFLSRINSIKDLGRIDGNSVYNKEEWEYILQNIRMKFPELETARRKTLKSITDRIASMENDLAESTGLWSQSMTATAMTEEELRWLYDLDDEQMKSQNEIRSSRVESQDQFVMTLSFNEAENEKEKEKEVEEKDSQGIEEVKDSQEVEEKDSQEVEKVNEIEVEEVKEIEVEEVKDSQEVVELKSMKEVKDSLKPQDSDDVQIYSYSVKESQDIEEIVSDSEDEQLIPTEGSHPDISSHQRETEFDPLISIHSFPFAESIPQDSPSNQVFEVPDSTAGSPIKFASSGGSPFKTPTKPRNSRNSMITSPLSKKAKDTLSRHQVDFAVQEGRQGAYTIRNVPKPELPHDEVPDSEEEDYSIIEISRSVLQVPSSPVPSPDKTPSIPRKSRAQSSSRYPNTLYSTGYDFGSLSMEQLRQVFRRWEIRPVKGKHNMVDILQETSKLVGASAGVTQDGSTRAVDDIACGLTRIIRGDPHWHDVIISYQPIKVCALQKWLVTQGYNLELDILEKYCFDQGICCTN